MTFRYRLNLATRPFRHYRSTNLVVAAVLAALAGFGVWEGVGFARFSSDLIELRAREREARVEWEFLGTRIAELERGLAEPEAVETVSRVRFLNAILERKAFSWNVLLREIERIVPPSVRIVTLVPEFGETGDVRLQMEVRGRSVEAFSRFLRALEDNASFSDVTVSVEEAGEVQGQAERRWLTRVAYRPPGVPAEVVAP